MKENPSNEEETWKEQMMDAESIVKMKIGSDGSVDTILINMDSNLVKKLICIFTFIDDLYYDVWILCTEGYWFG